MRYIIEGYKVTAIVCVIFMGILGPIIMVDKFNNIFPLIFIPLVTIPVAIATIAYAMESDDV